MTGVHRMLRSPISSDSGSALVGAQIILLSLIIAPLLWLTGDVSRSVSYRTTAREVAFEAARAGAWQADLVDPNGGDGSGIDGAGDTQPDVDTAAVSLAVHRSATESLTRLGLQGRVVDLEVGLDWVVVGVEILDGERPEHGRAGARRVDR